MASKRPRSGGGSIDGDDGGEASFSTELQRLLNLGRRATKDQLNEFVEFADMYAKARYKAICHEVMKSAKSSNPSVRLNILYAVSYLSRKCQSKDYAKRFEGELLKTFKRILTGQRIGNEAPMRQKEVELVMRLVEQWKIHKTFTQEATEKFEEVLEQIMATLEDEKKTYDAKMDEAPLSPAREAVLLEAVLHDNGPRPIEREDPKEIAMLDKYYAGFAGLAPDARASMVSPIASISALTQDVTDFRLEILSEVRTDICPGTGDTLFGGKDARQGVWTFSCYNGDEMKVVVRKAPEASCRAEGRAMDRGERPSTPSGRRRSYEADERNRDRSRSPERGDRPESSVLRLYNVPLRKVGERDIVLFFEGFYVVGVSVEDEKVRVEFASPEQALRAKEAKDKHMMRGECIECKVSRKFTTLPLPKVGDRERERDRSREREDRPRPRERDGDDWRCRDERRYVDGGDDWRRRDDRREDRQRPDGDRQYGHTNFKLRIENLPTGLIGREYGPLKDDLRGHFGRYGRVANIHIVDRGGSGYISFDSEEAMDRVMNSDGACHWDGRILRLMVSHDTQNFLRSRGRDNERWTSPGSSDRVHEDRGRDGDDWRRRDERLYDDRGDDRKRPRGGRARGNPHDHTDFKLMIGNLPGYWRGEVSLEDDLAGHFERFAKVAHMRVGNRAEFAFISFESEAEMRRVLNDREAEDWHAGRLRLEISRDTETFLRSRDRDHDGRWTSPGSSDGVPRAPPAPPSIPPPPMSRGGDRGRVEVDLGGHTVFKIIVRGLPINQYVSNEDLGRHFDRFDKVVRLHVSRHPHHGKCAFVSFESEDAMDRVMNSREAWRWNGNRLKLELSDDTMDFLRNRDNDRRWTSPTSTEGLPPPPPMVDAATKAAADADMARENNDLTSPTGPSASPAWTTALPESPPPRFKEARQEGDTHERMVGGPSIDKSEIGLPLPPPAPPLSIKRHTDAEGRNHFIASAPESTVLDVTNLPFDVTGQDIKDFFGGYSIVAMSLGVKQRGDGSKETGIGKACVQFASASLADRALKFKNGEKMRAKSINLDMAASIGSIAPAGIPQNRAEQGRKGLGASAPKGTVLVVKNLSSKANEKDVKHFFEGYSIVAIEGITSGAWKKTNVGHAHVQFASADEAERAMQAKNRQMMVTGREMRCIDLRQIQTRGPPDTQEDDVRERILDGPKNHGDANGKGIKMSENGPTLGIKRHTNAEERNEFVNSAPKDTVVWVTHLPLEVNEQDIKDFFEDFSIVAMSIGMKPGKDGSEEGTACVQFASANKANDAKRSKNRKMMGERCIHVDQAVFNQGADRKQGNRMGGNRRDSRGRGHNRNGPRYSDQHHDRKRDDYRDDRRGMKRGARSPYRRPVDEGRTQPAPTYAKVLASDPPAHKRRRA